MPGSAYYEEPELGGTYSSESELGQLSEEGEETDDASESESYNHPHQVRCFHCHYHYNKIHNGTCIL